MSNHGKRYDVAADRGPKNDQPAGSFWVVDMTTVREPDRSGVNVTTVAGPFNRIREAFDVASHMNLPWWKRLLSRRGLHWK